MSEKTMICDSVNHTRFPKEDHLPDRERRDNKVTKGDRAYSLCVVTAFLPNTKCNVLLMLTWLRADLL